MMEPKLGVVEEVACGQRDALWLRHVTDVEVALASVKPRKRIADAVVLQKLKFVRCGYVLVTRIVIIVPVPTAPNVSWSAMWKVTWCRVAATCFGGELGLREINTLDR
jgi:hypothetical protein